MGFDGHDGHTYQLLLGTVSRVCPTKEMVVSR